MLKVGRNLLVQWRITIQHLIIIVTISCIGIYKIEDFNMIHVVGDEFGYWGNAAYFVGVDWNELISTQSYYSFGYSFFLIPFFLLEIPMSLAYKGALIINILFLCGIYAFSYLVIKKIYPQINVCLLSIICGVCVLYPSFIVYAKTTFCETLLVLVYWVLIWLIIKYEETAEKKYFVMFIFLNIYNYIIHQRNIGILIAAVVILLLGVGDENRRAILLTFIVACLVLILGISIKENLIQNLWNSSQTISRNDFSGQVYKVKSIFQLDGIIRLFQGSLGKIFYFLSATMLFGGGGVYAICNSLYKHYVKKIEKIEYPKCFLFILLSLISNFAVVVVFLINIDRKDILLYGRYSETLIGPLLMIGLIWIYQNRLSMRAIAILISTYILSSLFIYPKMVELKNTELVSLTIVGLYADLVKSKNTAECLLYVCLFTVIIFVVLYLLFNFLKEKFKDQIFLFLLVLCSIMWISRGNQVINDTLLASHKIYNEGILPIAEYLTINNKEKEQEIFYVIQDVIESESDYRNTNIERLQFCISDYPIKIKQISEIQGATLDSGYCIILKKSPIYITFQQKTEMVPLFESKMFGIFGKT